jgi:hypothetical protein
MLLPKLTIGIVYYKEKFRAIILAFTIFHPRQEPCMFGMKVLLPEGLKRWGHVF